MKRIISVLLLTALFLFSFAQEVQAQNSKSDSKSMRGTRDIFTVGYQIGGYSLVGFNYEMRVSDLFGVHFGAGIAGFTGGVKIHTKPDVKSAFFNLSYKDGGFGSLNTAGVEFGGRWVFKPGSRFGLLYQIGAAAVLNIDEDFENELYGQEDSHPAMLSVGIGLSWSSKK